MDCNPPSSSVHGDSLGKNTGVGCHTLLQGIFPTQGSNLGLPHCRRILYQMSHQGSPPSHLFFSFLNSNPSRLYSPLQANSLFHGLLSTHLLFLEYVVPLSWNSRLQDSQGNGFSDLTFQIMGLNL